LPHTLAANHRAVFADDLADTAFDLQEGGAGPFVIVKPDAKLHPVLVASKGLAEEEEIR
jgi:hypothetical protein